METPEYSSVIFPSSSMPIAGSWISQPAILSILHKAVFPSVMFDGLYLLVVSRSYGKSTCLVGETLSIYKWFDSYHL